MKAVLMLIAPSDFRDEELLVPKRIFQDAKFEVTVSSDTDQTARGMLGAVSHIDLNIDKVNPLDYDAIVFVGGIGVNKHKIYENTKYLNIAKTAAYRGKIVAAICLGTKVLANAGLLTRKRATGWDKEYLREKGAFVQEEGVVKESNIITAYGPVFAKEFGELIKKALKG